LRDLIGQFIEPANQQNEGAKAFPSPANRPILLPTWRSQAAKEITQLIKESTRRGDEGAALSEKVGESFNCQRIWDTIAISSLLLTTSEVHFAP
jgi:hypothetical protein